ncbi:ABC transporter permease subunit [Mesorhizobium sp.]|uniref:ABC transporter permease n=1 Tax=Mesorhizobium sp. TaxID=1871066 RepID=UPI000FE2EB62|nr:ABC transporter permease subunit [Mesorhizobium sp.]RWN50302.1 MAG: ABC transporter permease subunit [Mesorhizobium sp.]RWN71276.1 MAG: ABC transporter permease subunit [Mesorhizobium sp.]RWN72019.1 MAG: ABC transporter permease subunit [Mesorhizobium sp.]RWN82257.1 MAG: ABC transporter permease subunit [Mesorhizobium sp.]RWO07508.1 MAG: ABC transporter permease subunit [Mesorhizobium sp.]
MKPEDVLDPFKTWQIPFGEWVDVGLGWIVQEYRPLFQSLKWPIDQLLRAFDGALNGIPPVITILCFGLIAWQIAGWRLAVQVAGLLVIIGLLGIWGETMTTLSLVFTAVLVCTIVGIPLGVIAARSDRAAAICRPILDTMQTIPSFVYLVPVVMLFGIGNVPGVIVTIIFALPPVIRLTTLGIQQVSEEVVEAMRAFGASNSQLLFKAQLPLALPSIVAGVNQTLMMSLSMVVVASMIAVGGLGQMVLRGIGRLDIGLAATGGIGIVILAIILDRLTQSAMSQRRRYADIAWHNQGPAALFTGVVKTFQASPAGRGELESGRQRTSS